MPGGIYWYIRVLCEKKKEESREEKETEKKAGLYLLGR